MAHPSRRDYSVRHVVHTFPPCLTGARRRRLPDTPLSNGLLLGHRGRFRNRDLLDSRAPHCGPRTASLPVLVALAAFTSAATRSLGRIADGLYLPFTYAIGQSALSAIVMLVLLALILLTFQNQQGLPETPGRRRLYFGWARAFVPLL